MKRRLWSGRAATFAPEPSRQSRAATQRYLRYLRRPSGYLRYLAHFIACLGGNRDAACAKEERR